MFLWDIEKFKATILYKNGTDIHFWYGTKEAFVAKPQVRHLLSLCPQAHIEVFQGMNHGQLLIDHPEDTICTRFQPLNFKD